MTGLRPMIGAVGMLAVLTVSCSREERQATYPAFAPMPTDAGSLTEMSTPTAARSGSLPEAHVPAHTGKPPTSTVLRTDFLLAAQSALAAAGARADHLASTPLASCYPNLGVLRVRFDAYRYRLAGEPTIAADLRDSDHPYLGSIPVHIERVQREAALSGLALTTDGPQQPILPRPSPDPHGLPTTDDPSDPVAFPPGALARLAELTALADRARPSTTAETHTLRLRWQTREGKWVR